MKINPAFKLLAHCYVDYYKVTISEKLDKLNNQLKKKGKNYANNFADPRTTSGEIIGYIPTNLIKRNE